MHSPIVPRIWQGFAQPSQRAAMIVVTAGSFGQAFPHAGTRSLGPRLCPCRDCRDCTPSAFTRPSHLRGRPGLFPARPDARTTADAPEGRLEADAFLFHDMWHAVEHAATTTQRGIEPCISILSFSPLRPPPFRAACPPRPSAALAAPSPGRPSLTQWMKTWSRARPSARLPVPHPAACRGCRPAAATDLTAAIGRPDTHRNGPSGQHAPVALVISAPRPGRGGRGERCSRRS